MNGKKKCTPGVYLIKGEKGVRVGQSRCPEIRVAKVAKQYEDCIGKIGKVHIIPILDRNARLRLGKSLIEILGPKCNKVRA